MKNRIAILPDALVHKIAAGEVVERPVSVVKELLENSLDAKATQVSVSINQGGKRSIRVSDNGWGMNQQDALLALERHATSKIRNDQDLFNISSLGFRGEALPSIAAVSKMKLTSKTKEALAATQIVIEGGRIKRVTETGSPPGTIIEANNLFFNIPARYKFLKTTTTELGHITHYISQIALAHPQVQLSLYHQDKPLIEVTSNDARERIAELYGINLAKQLIAVEHENDKLRLSGYVSRPQLSRTNRDYQSVFVNRRLVKDRLINRAAYDAYQRLLPRGRHPIWVLFLEVAPELVDVNVHPAKTEVRFSHPQAIRQLVVDGIRQALATVSATPQFSISPSPLANPAHNAVEINVHQQQIKDALAHYLETRISAEAPPWKPTPPNTKPDVKSEPEPQPQLDLTPETAPSNAQFFSSLIPIGQFNRTFILCQSQQELVIIDQHAAHEKVLYEKLVNNLLSSSVPKQQLLFPQTLELSHREVSVIEEHIDTITEVGFEIAAFGGNTYILSAAPAYLDADAAPQAIQDIIAGLLSERKPSQAETKESLLHKIACHSAIKAHHVLQTEEIASLLAQLAKLKAPFNCPHGRPTLIRYHLSDINKQFQRSS